MNDHLSQAFADIVGSRFALRSNEDKAPYLREWRDKFSGKAALVLRPENVVEVSKIMNLAHESNTKIVPQGGNTGLVGGQIPDNSGAEVIVSLTRLNDVRAVDVPGNTMLVEAGVTLAEAQAAAAAQSRLFPLSLASEGSCQIGGNLSTNAGGTAVLAYGTMRQLTLGLEVVLPDGKIWNGLRGLRKDNTGYDLKDLFIGAEGTLGIITAAVLKLYPKPVVQATAFCGHNTLADVGRFFSHAQRFAGARLTTFELLPRRGLEFTLNHIANSGEKIQDPFGAPHNWYTLVELSESQADAALDEVLLNLLESAAEAGDMADAALAASLSQQQNFWRLRELMSAAQKPEGGSIKHDVAVAVQDIPEFITRGQALAEKVVPGCRPVPFGHFGDGNIHFNITQPVGMEREAFLSRWEAMSDAIHGLVAEMNGSISAEHGIGILKRDMMAALKDPVELELMQKIKQALDPKGVLNPGKILR